MEYFVASYEPKEREVRHYRSPDYHAVKASIRTTFANRAADTYEVREIGAIVEVGEGDVMTIRACPFPTLPFLPHGEHL